MAAFAPPLLRLSGRLDNFGFEICGPAGIGKSTCQTVMASVAGPARSHGRNYGISFYATSAGLAEAMTMHADLPMIIDEANLAGVGEAEGAQRKQLKDTAFQLANGRTKILKSRSSSEMYRFIYVTSANQPFHELIAGTNRGIGDAATDRLMTISIPIDREFGIFDRLPPDCTSSRELALRLERAIVDEHGTALRKFLKCLVKRCGKDEDAVKRTIRRHLDRFNAKVGVNKNSGSDVRVAEAFGLVYAAGLLAKHHKILPEGVDCLAAAIACYWNFRSSMPGRSSLSERLHVIANLPETLRLRKSKLVKLAEAEIEKHGAFLRATSGGKMELLLTEAARKRFFPDWKAISKSHDFRRLNKRDDDRLTVKRQIRSNKKADRFACFVMPEPAQRI